MCSRIVCFMFLYSDESDIDMYDDPEASQKIRQLEVFIGMLFYQEVKDFGDLIGEGKSEIRRKVKIEAVALIYKERFRLPFEQ